MTEYRVQTGGSPRASSLEEAAEVGFPRELHQTTARTTSGFSGGHANSLGPPQRVQSPVFQGVGLLDIVDNGEEAFGS